MVGQNSRLLRVNRLERGCVRQRGGAESRAQCLELNLGGLQTSHLAADRRTLGHLLEVK
jgi:hypothetical protein